MKTLRFITFLLILCSALSCTKNIDLDQIDNAEIHTNYLATLVYFNLVSTDFLDQFGQEIEFKTNVVPVSIDNNFGKYLEKIELTIVSENSFDREFNVQFELLDEMQTSIYTLKPSIVIPPNSGETTFTIEIPKKDIHLILDMHFSRFILQMLPSTNGSNLSDISKFKLKSSINLFVNYSKS